MKKISIAIPTYNRKEYLIDSLKSVLAQTEKDREIIVFDNHSDYDIEKAISEIDTNKEIRIEKIETNIGNVGNFCRIQKYKFDSKYLIIFHDDDTMHPNFLKEGISVMEKNPSILWLGTSLNFVNDDNKMFDFNSIEPFETQIVDTAGLIKKIANDFNNLCFDSVIYKTDIFTNGYPIETLYKTFNKWFDRPLLVELSKLGKVALVDEKCINYRIHSNQDSQQLDDLITNKINLLNYYSNELGLQGVTNVSKHMSNLIIIGLSLSTTTTSEFRTLLRQFKKNNAFKYRYVRLKGLYYFLRFFLKLFYNR